jgi:hypothetical protein
MNNIQLVSLWEQATFNEIIWCQVCIKQTRLVGFFSWDNCIGGVIVCVLALSTEDRRFEPMWGQSKDYTIGMHYLSAQHATLRSKSKYCLARNQNIVSQWGRNNYRKKQLVDQCAVSHRYFTLCAYYLT